MKRYRGAICLSLVILTGCNPMIWRLSVLSVRPNSDAEKHVMQAAHELDKIARDLDEYGSISASTAAIIQSPGSEFKFNLDLTPRQLFEERPVQGFSAIRNYEELAVRVAAAVALLNTGQVDEANQALAETLVGAEMGEMSEGTSTDGSASGGTDTNAAASSAESGTAAAEDPLANLPTAELPERRPSAIPEQFSPPLQVPDPSDLGLSMRDLIKRVFDDYATLKLFEWLSDPGEENLGDNRQLYAAVLNVSIRPGRSTYQGYTGEIDIRAEYAGKDGTGKVRRGMGEHPLSFAVFPAIDSQVVDFRTSLRKQFAFASLLEAAFPAVGGLFGGSGSVAQDYVKRLEQDAATRSALNTVVGYNASGRHFGWRFSPGYVAQADPTDSETGPGSILQAQSFPALVLILADRDDLLNTVGGNVDNTAVGQVHGERVAGPYDHLSFFFSSRWSRAPSPSVDESYIPFRSGYNRFVHPRLEEEQVAEWGLRLARARGWLDAAKGAAQTPHFKYATNAIAKRLNTLEATSIGSDSYWALPTIAPQLVLNTISPSQGRKNKKNLFVLQGEGFDSAMEVYIGGQKVDVVVGSVGKYNDTAVITVPKTFQPETTGALDVTIRHANLGAVTLGSAVAFNLPKSGSGATPSTPKARVEITWEKGAGGKAVIKSLSVHGEVTAKEVLDAVTRQAQAKTQANVNLGLDLKAAGTY